MKEKVYLQITSGRGPAECCRVVALVLFSCAKKNEYLIKKKEEDFYITQIILYQFPTFPQLPRPG